MSLNSRKMEDWKGVTPGDSVPLHVDSRKTGVLLSLNSPKTGGLEWRKARGQRVPARRQS